MWNVLVLGVASFLTDVSSEMVYPLLPLFLTATLGASPAVLGVVEGVAESVASLLRVFSGALSDRLGHRKGLTIAGYGCSAVGKLLLAVAHGWGMVLAGRVVDRVGKGTRTAPRDALIADAAAADHRGLAFGLHRALDSLGAVIGVAIAWSCLGRAGETYAAVFAWSVVPAALAVATLFLVREPRAVARPAAPMPVLRWRALPVRLRRFLVVAFCFALGNSSNAFLLLRAASLGVAPSTVVLLYLVYNVVYAAASYPGGRLSDRIGRRAVLVAGYALYGLVYLGFALARGAADAWATWPLFALYGAYIALTDGVEKALVSDLAPAELRATALGLHATLVGLGLFPASFVAGQLWTAVGPAAPFWLGGATGLAAGGALVLVLGPSARPAPPRRGPAERPAAPPRPRARPGTPRGTARRSAAPARAPRPACG